jgi:hypothetical protein
MNKILMLLVAATALFASCKNNKTATIKDAASADTTKGFPIIELLKNDIDETQKVPYYIYKITTHPNDKKYRDSVAVSPQEFAKLIAPIRNIVLEKEQYKEDAFHDLSTASISIMTKALNSNAEVVSITTLLNDETNKLKSIFIVMKQNLGDTTVHTNYFWKAGKSLSIGKETSLKNGTKKAETQFINWNDK